MYKNRLLLLLLVISVACNQKKTNKTFAAGTLNIAFNEIGALVSLTDTNNNTDYQYIENNPKSILAIRVNGDLEYPKSFELRQNGEILRLNFPKNSIDAEIKVVKKEKYTTFELSAITKKDSIELVLWGPFETKIKETIGETVGVVRNKDFAIGI